MTTPLSKIDGLRIGSVDFVSPDEIRVVLDVEAPSDIALNAGVPRPFPRVNSYKFTAKTHMLACGMKAVSL